MRCLHKNVPASAIPAPTPFVPDVPTFFKLIGRQMSKHSSKFSTWDDLFTMSSDQMRELGLEPTRQRRYLLRWRDKFRRGEYGVGGDLQHVENGVAEIRVVEVPRKLRDAGSSDGSNNSSTKSSKNRSKEEQPPQPHKVTATLTTNPGMRNAVVNLPLGETQLQDPLNPPKKPAGIKIFNGNMIKGPYLKFVPGTSGTAARIEAEEGMWEHKLGRKIDGGERRRAEVRAKKRTEERKKRVV